MQISGVALESRVGFQDHVVLVHLGIHRVDLTLPESVVQRVVYRRRRDPEARGRRPVDGQGGGNTVQLLVRDDVGELGQSFQFRQQIVHDRIELVLVRVFQGVLILRAADAVIDGQVLNGLHVKLDARDLVQFRIQPADHLRSG